MGSSIEHIPRLQQFLHEIGYRHSIGPPPPSELIEAHHHFMHHVFGPHTPWTVERLSVLEEASVSLFHRAYPFADVEMKAVLAKLAAIALFLDDSLDNEEAYNDIGHFAHRIYLGEPQPNGFLTLYQECLQEMSKMHEGDAVMRNLAVIPWIVFVDGCLLERRLVTVDEKLRCHDRTV